MKILSSFKNHTSHRISTVASRLWKTEYQPQVKTGLVPYIYCLLQQVGFGLYSRNTFAINTIDNTDYKVSVTFVGT